MRENLQFYIDGSWVEPAGNIVMDVINPADETVAGQVALGGPLDVDKAVAAARAAFQTFSQISVEERLALFDRIIAAYQLRAQDLAIAVSDEMGAPLWLAEQLQVTAGLAHIQIARAALAKYSFEHEIGRAHV